METPDTAGVGEVQRRSDGHIVQEGVGMRQCYSKRRLMTQCRRAGGRQCQRCGAHLLLDDTILLYHGRATHIGRFHTSSRRCQVDCIGGERIVLVQMVGSRHG